MDLTPQEQALLEELDHDGVIMEPSRKAEGWDRARLDLLKGLVYKDLISFGIGPDWHYVFYSRSRYGGVR